MSLPPLPYSPHHQPPSSRSVTMSAMSGPQRGVYPDSTYKSPSVYDRSSTDDSEPRLPSFHDFSRRALRSHHSNDDPQSVNNNSISDQEPSTSYYGRSSSIPGGGTKPLQSPSSVSAWSSSESPSFLVRERFVPQQERVVSPSSPALSFHQHRYSDSVDKPPHLQTQISPFSTVPKSRTFHAPPSESATVHYQPKGYGSSVGDYGKGVAFSPHSRMGFENGGAPAGTMPFTSPDGYNPQGYGLMPTHLTQRFPRYELRIRQQPHAARACGFGERDRRVIDPPPIVQLIIRDQKTGEIDLPALRCSLNTLQCTLYDETGTVNETIMCHPDRYNTRRLMGQTVASPAMAKDEHDVEGSFFCFPDLSCRTHGRYRLKFILIDADPDGLFVGGFSRFVVDVLSSVFTVYSAKDFPGMRASSALTRALKLQGCNIQVKKGSERAALRHRPRDREEEERPHDMT